jgi:hypothetical protein
MATFTYPTAATIQEVARDFSPRMQAGRAIFDVLPTREQDTNYVVWEQKDNYVGLMQVRGLNGEPPKVSPTGFKQYVMPPGVYGEWAPVSEADVTERRAPGTFGTPIDVADLIADRQTMLLGRCWDRFEWVGWTLLTTGTFSVTNIAGAVTHTDSYTTQTFSATVPWATAATATPLADLSAVALLARGSNLSFGADAKAYMNRKTFNYLRANANSADLYGRRSGGFGTINNQRDINTLLAGDDLPQLVVYDNGYYASAGSFSTFIPDNKVVVVGKRLNGDRVGEFLLTRNANTTPMGSPGVYSMVHEIEEPPRGLRVHVGANFGPALYYPGSIVLMTVS